MRKTKTGMSVAACLAASFAIAPVAFGQATIIYDNTANFLGQRTSPQNAELGDIVTFSSSTSDRLLAEFSFEYFMTSGSGNETAQVFIRNLVNGNPGQILFQSAVMPITPGPNGYRTRIVDGLFTPLPDSVAYTVKFAGFEGTEEAGLLFYNGGATVGSNPLFNGGHFSIQANADGSFAILDTPGVIDNLGVRFTAVPEPSTWALMLGGLAGFGMLRRRKA